jgi:hypothetical protein
MRPVGPSRWNIALVLLGTSLLWVAFKLIEALLTGGFREGDFTWAGVLKLAGFGMLIFWYAAIVVWGREERRFGVFRRPINGLLLACLVGAYVWAYGHEFDSVMWVSVMIAFGVGLFAEVWVQGL